MKIGETNPFLQNSCEEKPIKLLIAEDDVVIRKVLEHFSVRKGWSVIVAENGQAAIDAYQKQEFDVIIMDCQMPILDGYKAAGTIRRFEGQKMKRTPIIALTANALNSARQTCLDAGMDDYLTKPVETQAFYAIVDKWTKTLGE
ncbi:response regulator [Desulfosporosinus sp.]|uniref:response regulator n=1 Tax=Desulfosporosinus sp. TaxID=157907 RepID=UPI000E899E8E|nr:response regulator [Desulfosporosinus sp.]MBC2728268.1 response regulator [Desulfosporosinus sp.]HBV85776.1 hypothetical protein [Desulfosporosinus sp.]